MRKVIVLGLAGLAVAACTEQPHYSYPPAYEAPMAPSPTPRRAPPPPPPYVAPTPAPRAVTPLGVRLTAKNVGDYTDNEERELRADLRGSGVGVTRPGDAIVLYMRDDLLFAPAGARLSGRADEVVSAIASICVRYDSTVLTVNGYTDTTGSPDRQMALSRDRADAVAHALAADGVNGHRIVSNGYGATHLKIPTGPHVTEPRNNRVEIVITPKVAG